MERDLMITYADRACFHRSHKRALSRAQTLVARVSDAWGDELRCHELARALRTAMADDNTLAVIDGHCGMIEHSWLCFSDGTILDAYAPGRLPAVQIIDGSYVASSVYRPGARRRDIRRSIVDRLVVEMRHQRDPSISVRRS